MCCASWGTHARWRRERGCGRTLWRGTPEAGGTTHGLLEVALADVPEQQHALDPSPLAKVLLAQVYGYAGQKEKVLPLLDEAARTGRYVCPYEAAVAHLTIGDMSKAMDLLEDAYRKRSNCLVFLRVDSRLEPIRQPPYREQYLDLLARVGLDDGKFKTYPRFVSASASN